MKAHKQSCDCGKCMLVRVNQQVKDRAAMNASLGLSTVTIPKVPSVTYSASTNPFTTYSGYSPSALYQAVYGTGTNGTAHDDAAFAGKQADFDFSMGEVYGLRVWRVDQLGRLKSLHIEGAPPWRPGINEASCMRYARYAHYGHSQGVDACKDKTPNEKCVCGFYAYTHVGHDELAFGSRDGYALGLVRGTGRTLLGTKGFRCQKAEVVAIQAPTHLAPGRAEALRQAYPNISVAPSLPALLEIAPLSTVLPDPSSDDFWELPA